MVVAYGVLIAAKLGGVLPGHMTWWKVSLAGVPFVALAAMARALVRARAAGREGTVRGGRGPAGAGGIEKTP